MRLLRYRSQQQLRLGFVVRQLQEIRELVADFGKMIANDIRRLSIIDTPLQLEQFENRKQNVTEQQKNLNCDKQPE